MPAGVSQMRCGALPSRGFSVVPLSTIAPTVAFEKPSMRVYSSPKPTQPDNSTIGEVSFKPQNSSARRLMRGSTSCGRDAHLAGAMILRRRRGLPYDRTRMFHLILYQPEIPPNTGNVIRLCANVGATLHLVHPLGFSMDAAAAAPRRPRLSRAREREGARGSGDVLHGPRGSPAVRDDDARGALAVRRAVRRRRRIPVRPRDARPTGRACFESFPPERRLRIPLRSGNRSLNLSNAAAVTFYEAWRQLDFRGGA